MTTTQTIRSLTTTETAKIIRTDLKAAFPGVKFSVRSSNYAGGSSIDIKWTDGPLASEVDEIAGAYEGRGFDGMIDMAYSIDGWMLNGKIIGTRSRGTEGSRGSVPAWGIIPPHDDAELIDLASCYISTQRRVSPDLARTLIAKIAEFWGGVTYLPEVADGYDGYKMVNDSDYYRNVRDDLRLEWREAIHRASVDPTQYVREAR